MVVRGHPGYIPRFPIMLTCILMVRRITCLLLRSFALSSRSVYEKGSPRGCLSSVSLGFDRVESASPGCWAEGNPRFYGVNPPLLGDHLIS